MSYIKSQLYKVAHIREYSIYYGIVPIEITDANDIARVYGVFYAKSAKKTR